MPGVPTLGYGPYTAQSRAACQTTELLEGKAAGQARPLRKVRPSRQKQAKTEAAMTMSRSQEMLGSTLTT